MVLSFCGIWILQKVPQPVISTFVDDSISFDETFPEMLVLTIVAWMVF